MPKTINEYGPLSARRPATFGRRSIKGRRNPSEIRWIERASCAKTFRATFLRSPHSTDRAVPAVVWERDDQMSGPSGGGRRQHRRRDATPCPLTAPNSLRAAGRVTARDVPSVVPWWSRKVECREGPLGHPGDKCLRGQAGDGVDPRGAVAAVPTAQAEREFSDAHAGMGAGKGQPLGGLDQKG